LSTIHQILQQYWGYESFRALQEEIIQSALDKVDTLALLPTGGGKSICFQVPTLAQEGLCLVVSPLIALMKDQVENLKKRNIKAAAIFSGMQKREIDATLDNCIYGHTKFLYLSPERLATAMFKERLKKMRVSLVAIDEAHCISQWGYDFRPAYLNIAELRNALPNVPFLALTASATPRVQQDIKDKLLFGREHNTFQKSFTRKNLSYSVFYEENKPQKLLHILKNVQGCGIVYVRSRKRTQQIAQTLKKQGIRADFYHAGLSPSIRNSKQNAWMSDNTRIMVCTNAFGMGIDKPNVRVVVHIDIPQSLEAYYQEAGRGGRDGKRAFAVLLYDKGDLKDLETWVNMGFPPRAAIKKTYQSLANYYKIAIGAGQDQSFPFNLGKFCKIYKLKATETFSSLKVLQENNYINTNDAFEQSSRLMFLINREEIYKIEVSHRRLQPYIKGILRTYGGTFEDYVSIKEGELARNLRTSVAYVKNALLYMHKHKLIDYVPQTDEPKLTFTLPRANANNLIIDQKILDFRKKVQLQNIAGIIAYTENKIKCRSKKLVTYFGEFDANNCGICDVCLRRKKLALNDSKFEKITTVINQLLNEQKKIAFAEMVVQLTRHYGKEEVITTLRWLADNGHVLIDEERNIHLRK